MSKQTQTPGETKLTTPSDREIVAERVFDAPRKRVFEVFTDPELIPVTLDRVDELLAGTTRS